MAEIIQIRRKTRYRTGKAICNGCLAEWDAETEGESNNLECPSCLTMNGHFKWPYAPAEGQLGYQCDCGCEDFFIMKSSINHQGAVFCRNCGNENTGWFE